MTALCEVIHLQKRGEALGTISPALVPTQQQTKNLLTYTQQQGQEKGPSKIHWLHQTLQWPDITNCMVYPTDEDPSVINQWENQEAFTIIMLLPHASKMVEKFRMKVVGLNGLFKSNKLRFPLYTLGVTDERGHTWPITVAFSLSSKHSKIMHFLSMVHTKIKSELDIIWEPVVMINKDATEWKAVEKIRWPWLLCDFHVQHMWSEKACKVCKGMKMLN